MRIFSYLVNVPDENPRGHGEEIPGRVSCNSSEGYMRVLTNAKNLISKMSNYFDYLARAAHAEDDLDADADEGADKEHVARERDGAASGSGAGAAGSAAAGVLASGAGGAQQAFIRLARAPNVTRGNWTSPYLDSCGLGIVITYAVPVISWHTNQ